MKLSGIGTVVDDRKAAAGCLQVRGNLLQHRIVELGLEGDEAFDVAGLVAAGLAIEHALGIDYRKAPEGRQGH